MVLATLTKENIDAGGMMLAPPVDDGTERVEVELNHHSPQADDAPPPAERLDLPLSPSAKSTAAVYVRQQPYDLGDEPLDSSDPAPTRYESIGLFNGEQVFYGDGYTSRKFAIEDAERGIAHAAAALSVNSKKKAHKLAAKELNDLLTAVENIASSDDEDIPTGEACEWPGCAEAAGEQADGEQTTDEQPTGEQTANAGLAGSGETTGAESSPQAAVSPAPARKPTREEIIADFERDMVAVARRLASVVLRRKAIEADLKDVKEDEKRVVGELEALTDRGPEFMPLFDAKSGESPLTSPASPSEGAAGATTANDRNDHAAPDAWRATPIDALGLPPKLAEKLADSSITTIGALEDLRGSYGGLSSIKGIGPAKITLIEDAVMGWLTENRDAAVFAGARDGEAGRDGVSVESVESPAAAEDPDAKAFE